MSQFVYSQSKFESKIYFIIELDLQCEDIFHSVTTVIAAAEKMSMETGNETDFMYYGKNHQK